MLRTAFLRTRTGIRTTIRTGATSTTTRSLSMGVIGAGQMGLGIAYISSKNHQITLIDSNESKLKKGKEFIEILLKKDLLKGKINDQEAQVVRGNIEFSSDLNKLKKAEFCIEVGFSTLITRYALVSLTTRYPRHH
jgi:3-hydroxybutyryl-CoA dehydrogenase